MIPLRDDIPSRTTPYVNYAILAITSLVGLAQINFPDLTWELGMIPARVLDPDVALLEPLRAEFPRQAHLFIDEPPASLVPPVLTPLTCIFLHGGLLHFLGNMWFLWIFGDNVEDRLGHVGFAVFYLACGVLASLAHLATGPDSPVPTIGASGAIAGVMGAYFYLYPKAKVLALIPLGFILTTFVVPATLFLGLWFLLQLLRGSASAGSGGGVAWWAHVGGFVAGLIVAAVLGRKQKLKPAVADRRPPPKRFDPYETGRSRRY